MLNRRASTLLLLAIALAACSSSKRAHPASAPHLGTRAAAPRGEPRYESATSTAHADARIFEEDEGEGLGTLYGERRYSDTDESRFERASSRPDAVLSLWYDDYDGVRAVGDSSWRSSSLYDSRADVTLTLVDGHGRVLDALDSGHQRYAVGEPGQRYEIELTNHSHSRYEVVASVDGLDVIDGGDASTHKRGYILEPLGSLVIDGWRTHEDEVAAFRFGRVEDSYAARRGARRDIGVIGVAFFSERPRWNPDRDRRRRARPFDDRFAPPPW